MFSDWLRLELLSARGGLWIDISSIALHGFDWIQQIQRDTPLAIDRSASTIDLAGHAGAPTYPEAILYQQRVWQQQSAYPLVESWFIATVPRGRFVSAWRDEFNAFLASGMKGGQYARHWGVDMQGMPGHLYDYLAVLVTAQKVMQVDGILAGDSAVVLDAEDGPFYRRLGVRVRAA